MSQFTSCSKRKPLPSCQITLTDYFFRRSVLYLPLEFAKSSGLYNRQCDITIVDEKERHWEMMLSSKMSNYYSYISKGWKDLRLANSFKPGDILIIQLIKNGEKPILKCYSSTKRTLQSTSCSKRKPLQSVPEGVEHCQVTFTDYNIKSCLLYLPLRFARLNGLHNRKCDLTVIDGEERHWEMRLNYKKNDGRPYLVHGWKQLQLANSFKPGDILIFQLIKNGGKPILKCYSSQQKKKAHDDSEAKKQRKDTEVGNDDNDSDEIEVSDFETESFTKRKSTSEWVDSLNITPCSQQTMQNEAGDVNVYGRQEVIHMVDGFVKVANSVLISKIQRRLDSLSGIQRR